MVQIRTVLCPVDFSSLSDRELDVAVELCEAFEARLVLHHNLALAPPAWSKAWEWEETHPPEEDVEARTDRRMKELLARLPASVRSEAVVSHGLVVPVLLHLVHELPADLVVLGSHGWSHEDHASVAERIIESCPCPVLTIRDSGGPTDAFRLRAVEGYDLARVLVPTDFSKSGDEAVRFAFDLARVLPVRVHLLHVAAGKESDAVESAQRKLLAMVPGDLALRSDCSVKTGPVADELLKFAQETEPRLIVMGRHARGLLGRFFTRDNAQQMLHQASCPVLFAA
jgi:universal stress protein A